MLKMQRSQIEKDEGGLRLVLSGSGGLIFSKINRNPDKSQNALRYRFGGQIAVDASRKSYELSNQHSDVKWAAKNLMRLNPNFFLENE